MLFLSICKLRESPIEFRDFTACFLSHSTLGRFSSICTMEFIKRPVVVREGRALFFRFALVESKNSRRRVGSRDLCSS